MFVITTFERCESLQAGRYARGQWSKSDPFGYCSNSSEPHVQALKVFLSVRWQRLVVDEGHDLASTINSTNNAASGRKRRQNSLLTQPRLATELISEISAEKRWVMSGTPTSGTQTAEALLQLQRLLAFLRHPMYGPGVARQLQWQEKIAQPFLDHEPAAFDRLVALLDSVMLRSTKVSACRIARGKCIPRFIDIPEEHK